MAFEQRKVLSISSQVAWGPVGNSAAVPVLQRLGHEVIALPTVIWSHHPGHGKPAGCDVPGSQHSSMLSSLKEAGAFSSLSGIMSGYFRNSGQVSVISRFVEGRQESEIYFCDPVIGDDNTGVYVGDEVAAAIRDDLLPKADIAMPNRFELEWLSGLGVSDVASAVRAAATLPVKEIVVTSVPAGAGKIATVYIRGNRTEIVETELRPKVPHGTGDLLAGLFMGYLMGGFEHCDALKKSVAGIETVLDYSGTDTLNLAALGHLDD